MVIKNFHKQEVLGRELNSRGEDGWSLSDGRLKHRELCFGSVVPRLAPTYQLKTCKGLIAMDLQFDHRSN